VRACHPLNKGTQATWGLQKRYSEFAALQDILTGETEVAFPRPIPNYLMTAALLETRRKQLNTFLHSIVDKRNQGKLGVKLGYVVDRFLEMNEHGTISDAATALYAAVQNQQLDAVSEAIHTAPNSVFDSTEGGATALHFAAFQGYCDGLEMILEAGADKDASMHSSVARESGEGDASTEGGTGGRADGKNEPSNDSSQSSGDVSGGATALHLAAISGSPECVARLLEAGATVDAVMGDGTTALAIAAYHAHDECVKQLLAAGASVHAKSTYELREGWPGGISENTNSGSGSGGGGGGGGGGGSSGSSGSSIGGGCGMIDFAGAPFTALHYAACAGSVEIAQQLLEAGASSCGETSTTHSPLAVAAANGQLEVMELLIAWGALEAARARPRQRNKGGSPVQKPASPTAASQGTPVVPVGLYAVSLGSSPHGAAAAHESLLTELPSRSKESSNGTGTGEDGDGSMLNGLDGSSVQTLLQTLLPGVGALVMAAATGHSDCLNLLLSKNVPTEPTMEMSMGSAHEFARSGCTGGSNASNTNAVPPPLFAAAANGHLRCVQTLLEHGADINVHAGGSFGVTPLWIAARNGHLKCTQYLLEWPSNQLNEAQAARVNARLHADEGGAGSAFMLEASEAGGAKASEAAGGERSGEDSQQCQAAAACEYVTDAMLSSVDAAGAKLLGWSEGFTALDVALQREDDKMVRLLRGAGGAAPSLEPASLVGKRIWIHHTCDLARAEQTAEKGGVGSGLSVVTGAQSGEAVDKQQPTTHNYIRDSTGPSSLLKSAMNSIRSSNQPNNQPSEPSNQYYQPEPIRCATPPLTGNPPIAIAVR
jgi:ankyrin repeat protein